MLCVTLFYRANSLQIYQFTEYGMARVTMYATAINTLMPYYKQSNVINNY